MIPESEIAPVLRITCLTRQPTKTVLFAFIRVNLRPSTNPFIVHITPTGLYPNRRLFNMDAAAYSYWPSFAWGLIVLAAFAGWGCAAARVARVPAEDRDGALLVTWGMAAVIAI